MSKYILNKISTNYYCAMIDEDLHIILTSFCRLESLCLSECNLVSIPRSITKLPILQALSVIGCKNL